MRLIIISCTPRAVNKSNTAKIIEKFKAGFEKAGNTTEIYYLSQRNTWNDIRDSFNKNSHIIFALPLFVECVPGIMLEFLETLEPKYYSSDSEKTRIGFILQGGFIEACQLRCGEQYLEKLPGHLNCEYAGTLIKGDMFAVSIIEGKARESMIQPFENMGEYYAKHGAFPKEIVSDFAKPEYFSKSFIIIYTLLSPVQKIAMSIFAKRLGCKGSLKAKPYEKYITDYINRGI